MHKISCRPTRPCGRTAPHRTAPHRNRGAPALHPHCTRTTPIGAERADDKAWTRP
ncbi:hypothetical protein [Kitasatospora sp. NBC_01300]|uniref:hypothetical protein n=1 Tax=Kitasatospora sp. NBC_01300 TaxID=2903574 RepID=UPI002F91505C|nr:hypothetical protein OG556_33810 [Kitasatospora sp. NBC_01300]WSK09942.1 hypothetical protein OG556_39765 [Kitasatospora sp. NBC_01300]